MKKTGIVKFILVLIGIVSALTAAALHFAFTATKNARMTKSWSTILIAQFNKLNKIKMVFLCITGVFCCVLSTATTASAALGRIQIRSQSN